MKESVWGYFVIIVGIIMIFLIFFFQNITNTDEHNMALLKGITESSMDDAVDWNRYQASGELRINEAVFIENFIRRFAEDAQLASTYKIEFYNIQEEPPLVNIKVYSTETTSATGDILNFRLVNTINAILETDPNRKKPGAVATIIFSDGDEETYTCKLEYENGQLILYDTTNKPGVTVEKAYLDGEANATEQPRGAGKVYVWNQASQIAIHTGNLIYSDGNVATCSYKNSN